MIEFKDYREIECIRKLGDGEAIAFFEHLKAHEEVKNAVTHLGVPVCKICGKTSKQIMLGK